jgi:hypothetical protein
MSAIRGLSEVGTASHTLSRDKQNVFNHDGLEGRDGVAHCGIAHTISDSEIRERKIRSYIINVL